MTAVKNIAIVGSGNIAHFLAELFYSKQFNILQIISRNEVSGRSLASKVKAIYSPLLELNPEVHLILLCVPDEQIESCTLHLPNTEAIVCHCAGSIAMQVLNKFKHYGVLYPLQTITKDTDVNTDNVPFLLEASSPICMEYLTQVVNFVGVKHKEVNSEERLHYHLAAVFANNFTNAMLMATQEIARKNELDFSLLEPLIRHTFEKLRDTTPFEAQTGPAKRNDAITIKKHLDLLKADPDLAGIYLQISDYITNSFKN